jgi:hypothetical protein
MRYIQHLSIHLLQPRVYNLSSITLKRHVDVVNRATELLAGWNIDSSTGCSLGEPRAVNVELLIK